MSRARLGIVVSHPIQYQVPLYRQLAASSSIEPLVFYLTRHGLDDSFDRGFGRTVKYDVPLLGGYEHVLVPNRSPRPALSSPWGLFNPSLPALIRRSRIDAILVHGYSSLSHWLAYTAAVGLRIPYLLRGESRPDARDAPRARVMLKKALIRPLIHHAGACLAIGTQNNQFYASYGGRSTQVFFAPYSVDTERFAAAGATGRRRRRLMLESLGLDPQLPMVLFAAKLQPWKRPADVVMAADRMPQPPNLVMIGDGPLYDDMADLASTRPWMRVLGFVNQTAIAEWYGAADMFVLPSDREPWGLAVNEAMAAGAVPIVSDAVGCSIDLISPEIGWVYPAADVQALAATLTEACAPGALAARRSAAQRRSREYGIAATVRGIETAVNTVLGR
jgi:glycosyltransferase involved in cell wall biosynthesis